jgi:drug/metabolite transporter (DMT)-like permease
MIHLTKKGWSHIKSLRIHPISPAWLYAFVALFLWGIHGPAGHYLAKNNVDMFFVFSTRLWMGSSVFFAYLLYRGRVKICLAEDIKNVMIVLRLLLSKLSLGKVKSKNASNHDTQRIDKAWLANIKKVLVIASIGVIANTIIFHLALIYLPGTLVMILENLAPVFVFSCTMIFYGIKPKTSEVIALGISLIGILLLVMGRDSFPTDMADGFYIGVILGILTGVTFGGYIFFSADLMKNFKNNPDEIIGFLFKIFFISALVCTPFVFTSTRLPSTPSQWFWLIEMGILQSGLAYICWNLALAHIRANTASILFLLTILFTTINEVMILKWLPLNKFLVAGGLLICLAGYFISVSLREKRLHAR